MLPPTVDQIVIDPPPALLAEHTRLGRDGRDEVWDGEYHMVPPPIGEHQRIGTELLVALHPAVGAAGLAIQYETALLPSDAPGWGDFRVPDLVVFHPSLGRHEGVVGPAALVVEISSPGDGSLAKLGYYERLEVAEVLVVDRDTKAVRRWRRERAALPEVPADGGRHRLSGLDAVLRPHAGRLEVDVAGRRTVI